MGKRTIRILRNELESRLPELAGREAHVVVRGGQTHFGVIREANNQKIMVEDGNSAWYNRKKHQHQIPLETVVEVIFDEVSKY